MARWLGLGALTLSVLGFCLPSGAGAGEEKEAQKDQKKAEEKDQKKKEEKKKDQKKERRGDRKKKQQPKGWAVLQVGNELLVVQGEKIPDYKKLLEKENEKAAKIAEVSNQKKPVPKKLVVVKEGFSSQKEGERFAQKYKEEILAKRKAEKEKKAKGISAEPQKKIPHEEVEL